MSVPRLARNHGYRLNCVRLSCVCEMPVLCIRDMPTYTRTFSPQRPTQDQQVVVQPGGAAAADHHQDHVRYAQRAEPARQRRHSLREAGACLCLCVGAPVCVWCVCAYAVVIWRSLRSAHFGGRRVIRCLLYTSPSPRD